MDDYLFIGMKGCVAAINKSTGIEEWRTKLADGFFSAVRSSNVAVLYTDGILIAGCNGHLFGIETKTGKKLWHNELEGAGYGDLSLSTGGVSVQYLQKTVVEQHDTHTYRYIHNT